MEDLLTSHPYRRQIAELPDEEIKRLRSMLHEAVNQAIPPREIYDAITRGFNGVLATSISSPPLAYELREAAKTKDNLLALLREVEPTR
jgi:hypothetical protein